MIPVIKNTYIDNKIEDECYIPLLKSKYSESSHPVQRVASENSNFYGIRKMKGVPNARFRTISNTDKEIGNHLYNIIDSLRNLYSNVNKRNDVLLRSALKKKQQEQEVSMEEICAALKITKSEYKNYTFTYDYKGKLVIRNRQTNTLPNKFISKTSFAIGHTNIKELTVKLHKEKKEEEISRKVIDKEKVLAKVLIAPTYGVKYLSRNTILNGKSFIENPTHKIEKITLTDYNRQRNIKVAININDKPYEDMTYKDTKNDYKEEDNIMHLLRTNVEANLSFDMKDAGTSFYPTKIKSSWSISNLMNRTFQKPINLIHTYDNTIDWDTNFGVRKNAPPHKPYKAAYNKFTPRNTRKYRSSRDSRKLPPPPLGLTYGHGLFPKVYS